MTDITAEMDHHDLPAGLSDAQDKLLALLPIPSSTLSIIGSTIIIFIILESPNNRGDDGRRKWTPYSRLLLGMSICDIFSSISIALAGFLRPQGSIRAWAFGNDATCTATGFLIQFSWSGMIYYNMLSLYFLLSTRFGMKNTTIARRIEPIMHIISTGYPFITGVVGVLLDMYSETSVSFGCWVNEYPRGCTDETNPFECKSVIVGWIFYGIPFWISSIMLASNNIAIFLFVRNQVKSCKKKLRRKKTTAHDEENLDDLVHKVVRNKTQNQSGCAASFQMTTADELSSKDRAKSSCGQIKRLQLVRSQAILFVVTYTLCVSWGALVILVESLATTKTEEVSLSVKYFPVLVGNAIFAPLAGFLNMVVFLRPKFLRWKQTNPQSTNLQDFWSSLFEVSTLMRQRKTPTISQKSAKTKRRNHPTATHAEPKEGSDAAIPRSHRDIISSLTISLHSAADRIQESESAGDSDSWLSSDSVYTDHSSGQADALGLEKISEVTLDSCFEASCDGSASDNVNLVNEGTAMDSDISSSGSEDTVLTSPVDLRHSWQSEERWSAHLSNPKLLRSKRDGVPYDESPKTPTRSRTGRTCACSSASMSSSSSITSIADDLNLSMPTR